MLRCTKKTFNREKILEIDSLIQNKDPKKFWSAVNKLGPKQKRNTVCETIDEHGNVTRDPTKVKEAWEHDFTKLYSDPLVGEFDNAFYLERLSDLANANTDDNSDLSLNGPISFNEVRRSVYAGKLRKACGVDGLPYESFQNTLCVKMLHEFYNLCFDYGMIPTEWTKSLIIPISKGKHTIATEPLTHRGLAMQSCVYKSYSYI